MNTTTENRIRNLISCSLVWNITCRTCLLQCCPCSWCRLQSSDRTCQRVRYTGRVGSWGSPSDLPGIRHSAGQMLPDGTGNDRWTCHKVESQSLPSCNHRLRKGGRGIRRGIKEAGEHDWRKWSGKVKELKIEKSRMWNKWFKGF